MRRMSLAHDSRDALLARVLSAEALHVKEGVGSPTTAAIDWLETEEMQGGETN